MLSSYYLAKYCKKNKIRFIVDIQDLWPEAFKIVLKNSFISDILFYPMKKIADYIYYNADEIVAVSNTYANRALKKSNHNYAYSVFLGTDMLKFEECAKNSNKTNVNTRIAYVGTLGHSYNIKIIIDALEILKKRGYENVEFVVMGDGPLMNEFIDYAKESGVLCSFVGRLDYKKMVQLLCSCDIAVNPIVHGAAQSIINKVGDYAMAGLPVVSTQECQEYQQLLINYNAGFNCKNEDPQDVANCLEKLITDKNLRKEKSLGNKRLGMELFDRNKTYKKIRSF